jgi:hypothetical protein
MLCPNDCAGIRVAENTSRIELVPRLGRHRRIGAGSSSTSAGGGSLPGVVVGFRALSFMPGLLGRRHRSPDGVQGYRVRFKLTLSVGEALILHSWAVAVQGQAAEGLAQMRQGKTILQDAEQQQGRPFSLPCWPSSMGTPARPQRDCTWF